MLKETLDLSCGQGFCVAPENKKIVNEVLKNDPQGENVSARTVGRPCAGCLEIKKVDSSLIVGIQKLLQK